MKIPLRNKDKVVTDHTSVSIEDYDTVNKSRWYKNDGGYVRNDKLGLLSHFIHGKPREGYVIDHIDHNPLNNTRENLREITYSQNAQNKLKQTGKYSSDYIGVNYHSRDKVWNTMCQGNYIGKYNTQVEAARAYDKAVIYLFGKQAQTNSLLTPSEIDEVLNSDILPKNITKSRSVYGKGIRYRSKSNKYEVGFLKDYIGTYDTLEEAQRMSKAYIEKREVLYNKRINDMEITRNKDGVATLLLKNKNGVVMGYTLVDDIYWHELVRVTWSINNKGYVQGTISKKNIQLHRFIFNKARGDIPKNHIIDHIGVGETDPIRKRLDNRSLNLKAVTHSQNSQNRIMSSSNKKYMGVFLSENKKNWRVRISYNTKKIDAGTFPTEREAAEAYNKKALELFGDTARLNVI